MTKKLNALDKEKTAKLTEIAMSHAEKIILENTPLAIQIVDANANVKVCWL